MFASGLLWRDVLLLILLESRYSLGESSGIGHKSPALGFVGAPRTVTKAEVR